MRSGGQLSLERSRWSWRGSWGQVSEIPYNCSQGFGFCPESKSMEYPINPAKDLAFVLRAMGSN